MAMVKTLEFLAVENPGVFVASVHPGIVDTKLFQKAGAKPEMFAMDSGEFVHIPLLNYMERMVCVLLPVSGLSNLPLCFRQGSRC